MEFWDVQHFQHTHLAFVSVFLMGLTVYLLFVYDMFQWHIVDTKQQEAKDRALWN